MNDNRESGLICGIYRSSMQDCSLGGISSTAKEVLVILPAGGPFDLDDAARLGIPVCKLVTRQIGGEQYLHVEPIGDGQWSAGGTYVASCDSRFPNRYPLSLHDRDMNME